MSIPDSFGPGGASGMEDRPVRVLLVEDNKDFAKLVQVYLDRHEGRTFEVVWKESHAEAMDALAAGGRFDVVVLDYFLPGKTGLDIAQDLRASNQTVPMVFLTVNRSFDIALAVMKLGGAEYLVKEEVASPALPRTILAAIEQRELRERLNALEISRQRLRAIREAFENVVHDLDEPLAGMIAAVNELKATQKDPASGPSYVKMIEDNLRRISVKLEKIKQLKEDKTVRYIKDIRMLDLS